ncbi:unnamed protein product [Adineta steineri]|uniref:G-protein coupled receptors family 1 profile domain-containing protein n=1 Tax=Adineta steineri TaxID=433720 RepID=A0A815S3L1_9BILA|nr:unnamed protein product [Adineta steineri]CAF1639491.1 unnamed protein product [Adineta steineri]
MENLFIEIAQFLSGVYSLILILVGTPLNLLCFYIFTRLVPNRSNPTIIVFAHLALIELLIPFTWNINYVVRELLWKYQKTTSIKNVEQHSLFICKLIAYGAYFSLQCAAWLKTLATFARCVSLHNNWPLKKMAIETIFFQFWEIAHLLIYNFIPFTLMIFCNILIIRQVRESRNRTQRSKLSATSPKNHRTKTSDGGRLTKTLILVTIFFILFTSPAAIFYIFFGKKIKNHKNLITMTFSNLATTSHVTSFIIYWLTSADFRDAAISAIFCRPIASQRHSIEDKQHDKHISDQPPLAPPIVQSNDVDQRKLPLLLSS